MIVDYVDNVCKAKHLHCSPFPIHFKRATKSIPAFMDSGARTFVSSTDRKVFHILGMLNAFYSSKKEGKHVHILQLPSTSIVPFHRKQSANVSEEEDHVKMIWFGAGDRWTPLSKSASSIDSYNHGVLGDLGYL
jgi:hypothetical protein